MKVNTNKKYMPNRQAQLAANEVVLLHMTHLTLDT